MATLRSLLFSRTLNMDDNVFLETLDSLWFFSNIFSPPPSPSTSIHKETTKQAQLSPPQDPKKPSSDTHPIPQSQAQHEDSLSTRTQTVQTSAGSEHLIGNSAVCRAPRCIKESNIKLRKETSSREQRAGRKLKACSKVKEVEEYMQLGLRMAAIEYEATWISTIVDRQRFGLCGEGQSDHHCGIPALADGFAMKKHLKSWAHAVACTVK